MPVKIIPTAQYLPRVASNIAPMVIVSTRAISLSAFVGVMGSKLARMREK